MKRIIAFALTFVLLLVVNCTITFAQLGKDGDKSISGTVTNLNDYTLLISDATAGNTTIDVANSALNGGGNFSGTLSAGDLIMIIQMQGASMVGADDSTWGEVVNYNNAGNFEFAEVKSVPNSTIINLNCALQRNYSASGKVQVLRIPRYNTLTINSGSILTCPAWNGSIGGVLAVEVKGNTVIAGKIDISGKGFRGGMLLENLTYYGVGNHRWLTGDYGAEKGEGIGGYQGDYDIYGGRYCRGAAANGGGGGNAHNGGGGGGANGGNPATWSGRGNPDISNPAWINAWNLEYNGFAYTASSGGGRGGYTFSGINMDATVVQPGDPSWGGDHRHNGGGLGGRPLDYSGGKIFLGGGGGAGDQNESVGGAGGAGGGLLYLVNYGTISGNGQVVANGANGASTGNSFPNGGTDGAGGGGGGGTIILNSAGTISGITATANGGNGGSQSVTIFDQYEAEGPGAGGGGGYIATSNGFITCTAGGGSNGTTNSGSLSEFPCNGATKGGTGTANGSISNFTLTVSDTTICSGSAVSLEVMVNGNLPAGTTIYWYDARFGGNVLGSGTSFITPIVSASTTYYVGACPGTYRLPVNVTVDSVTANFSYYADCASKSLQAIDSSLGPVTSWSWDFGDGLGTSSQQNPLYIYGKDSTYTITLIASAAGGCNDTMTQTVTFATPPDVHFTADNVKGCDSLTVSFQNTTTNALSYEWYFGDGSFSTDTSPTHLYEQPGSYNVSLIALSSTGCSIAQSVIGMIRIDSIPAIPVILQNGDSLIAPPAASYQWYINGAPINGATQQNHIAVANGGYSVVVANSEGCSSTSSTIQVIINSVIDVSDSNAALFPNPINDYLEINFKTLFPYKIELSDVLGKVVIEKSCITGSRKNIILDVTGLSKNIYFLTFYYSDKKTVSKIIKE